MEITLRDEDKQLIDQKVEAGLYRDAAEAIHEAVRLLEERDRAIAELNAELQVGIDQADRGELIEFTPEFVDRIMQRIRPAESLTKSS